MRDDGFLCAVTERWNQYAKVRQDLFGFIDVICVRCDIVIAVQTTTGDNLMARMHKMRELESVGIWLQSPNRKIEIHGWRKVGKAGARKLWECRRVPYTIIEHTTGKDGY